MAATAVALHRYPLYSHFQQDSNNSHFQHASNNSHFPQLDNNHRSSRLVQKGRQGFSKWGAVNPRRRVVMDEYYGDDIDEDEDEDDEDEEEDRSLDLLIRFVENVYKKVSRKARKAVKSVLPVPMSTRLVGFAVNGTIILTFLWILKAFLEVICTLGSVVFTSILLVRGIWTGISYLQERRNYSADDDERQAWTRTRPAM